jgi:hypothetical protein
MNPAAIFPGQKKKYPAGEVSGKMSNLNESVFIESGDHKDPVEEISA